ncbi:MAG TPA: DNA polymerase III subunit delta [Blastocatellia bacterium]|nr:DNA polymerase III subunit delta [Blastocatellia bacterium]
MAAKKPSSGDALKSQTEFARKLQSGKFAPMYLLEGSENFLREQARRKLIDAVVDEALRDFNVSEISVAKGNLDEALAIARQYPMMSERRAVVITGFEAINDEDQLELLKDYIRDPVPSTVLIFDSPALDKRRNIATMLLKFCEVVSFEALDERDAAPRWVVEYVARTGGSMDSATAAFLVGMVGTELQQLATELDKLMTYVGARGRITKQEVELLVRYSREHSNFELTDALLEGNRKRALTLLEHIYANVSESEKQGLSVMILGAIARSYRNLLISKELMQQNAPNSEVAKAVGMSPYAVTHLNEKARRTDTKRILQAIQRIAATDVALKSSLGTPRLQIEMLIGELCPN